MWCIRVVDLADMAKQSGENLATFQQELGTDALHMKFSNLVSSYSLSIEARLLH